MKHNILSVSRLVEEGITLSKAKNWLENFGVEYLMYYHNQNNIVSRSKLRLTLEQQYLAFKCAGDVFVDLEFEHSKDYEQLRRSWGCAASLTLVP